MLFTVNKFGNNISTYLKRPGKTCRVVFFKTYPIMRYLFFLIVVSLAIIFSCKQTSNAKNLLPELKEADSAAILYYNTPNEPRFFSYSKIRDVGNLRAIIEDVNQDEIESRYNCATQGKIHFYGKKEVVYTIYFSDLDSCMTLSIIKTGEKYYTRMSNKARKIIEEWRSKAIVPLPAN